MTQQLRYNTGKPKLTYLFCAGRAMNALSEFCDEDHDLTGSPLDEAMREIVRFLDGGGKWHLANAAIQIGCAIEKEVTGDEPYLEEMSAFEALAAMPNALEAFCATCDYGEGKYARGNFRKGAPVTQYLDSALRHILARMRGETADPESNCRHLGHALWNVVEALDQPEERDDRLPQVHVPAPTPANDVKFDADLDEASAVEAMRAGKLVEAVSGAFGPPGNTPHYFRFNASTNRTEFTCSAWTFGNRRWISSFFPYGDNARYRVVPTLPFLLDAEVV